MPAYRSKMRCAFADPTPPKIKKPRKPRSELTEEEKVDAELKRMVNKGLREAKKEWEATLTPWVQKDDFFLPEGTIAVYKTDAKSAFNLNETEVLSLPFESVSGPSKAFYSYREVKALAVRKFEANACKMEIDFPGQVVSRDGQVRTFTKLTVNPKKRKFSDWMDNGRFSARYVDVMVQRAEEKQKAAGNIAVPAKGR